MTTPTVQIVCVYFQGEVIQIPFSGYGMSAGKLLRQTLESHQAQVKLGHASTQFCQDGYLVRCVRPAITASELLREGEKLLDRPDFNVALIHHTTVISYLLRQPDDYDGKLVSFVICPPNTLQEMIPLLEAKGAHPSCQDFYSCNELVTYMKSPPSGMERIAFAGTRWDATRPIFIGRTMDTWITVVLKYASNEEADMFMLIAEKLECKPQSDQHHLLSLFRPPLQLPHDHYFIVTRDMGDHIGVHNRHRLPLDHVSWAKQLCKAVAFLHENCIAHLDIKPENIVIHENGLLTLVDYSTARVISEKGGLIESAVGTRGWIAPEVELCFEEHTRKAYCPFQADIWAVGNVLVEAIATLDPEGAWSLMDEVVTVVGQWVMDERPDDLTSILAKMESVRKQLESELQ